MDKKALTALLSGAHSLFMERKFDEALQLFLQVIEFSPNEVDVYKHIAQIFLEKRDKKQYFHYLKIYNWLKAGNRYEAPELVEEEAPSPLDTMLKKAAPMVEVPFPAEEISEEEKVEKEKVARERPGKKPPKEKAPRGKAPEKPKVTAPLEPPFVRPPAPPPVPIPAEILRVVKVSFLEPLPTSPFPLPVGICLPPWAAAPSLVRARSDLVAEGTIRVPPPEAAGYERGMGVVPPQLVPPQKAQSWGKIAPPPEYLETKPIPFEFFPRMPHPEDFPVRPLLLSGLPFSICAYDLVRPLICPIRMRAPSPLLRPLSRPLLEGKISFPSPLSLERRRGLRRSVFIPATIKSLPFPIKKRMSWKEKEPPVVPAPVLFRPKAEGPVSFSRMTAKEMTIRRPVLLGKIPIPATEQWLLNPALLKKEALQRVFARVSSQQLSISIRKVVVWKRTLLRSALFPHLLKGREPRCLPPPQVEVKDVVLVPLPAQAPPLLPTSIPQESEGLTWNSPRKVAMPRQPLLQPSLHSLARKRPATMVTKRWLPRNLPTRGVPFKRVEYVSRVSPISGDELSLSARRVSPLRMRPAQPQVAILKGKVDQVTCWSSMPPVIKFPAFRLPRPSSILRFAAKDPLLESATFQGLLGLIKATTSPKPMPGVGTTGESVPEVVQIERGPAVVEASRIETPPPVMEEEGVREEADPALRWATEMEQLGVQHVGEGKIEEARTDFLEAAGTFAEVGNLQRAAEVLEKVHELFPDDLEILKQLNGHYERGARLKNATIMDIYRKLFKMKI